MKPKQLVLLSVIAAIATAASVYSFAAQQQEAAVTQLLQTGACPGCDLQNANLQGVDLSNMNLQGADLQGANLSGARLAGTDLSGANLKRANLEQITLTDANFANANLEQAQLSVAGTNCTTFEMSMDADDGGAKLQFNLDSRHAHRDSQNTTFHFNLNANDDSATIRMNGFGCEALEQAEFHNARMPDGRMHP